MKILHVLNTVSDAGNGISNVAVDLAVHQRRLGHDVFMASAGGGLLELLGRSDVAHHHVDFRTRRPLQLARSQVRLSGLLKATRPDIVHVHTITPTVLSYVATRARRRPVIATVHNEYQSGVRLMGLADRVIGVSAAVSDAMVARGIPRSKVRTVLNGTMGSARRPTIADESFVDLPPRSIVTVGSVSHRKGADVLLAAFEQVVEEIPDAHLYFVGKVDWDEPVESVRHKEWQDHVHFVGFQEEPRRYLANAAVFVMASRRDPMPLGVLEALEAGLPVVASAVDGIPEALDGGKAGLLVAAGDPVALAQGLVRLLRSDEERRRLAEAARLRASAFTVERMTMDYLGVYEEALT